jgi:hypothetical protein
LVIVSTEDHDSVKKQVEDAIDKALNRVKGLSYRVADMDVPESDRGKNSESQLID